MPSSQPDPADRPADPNLDAPLGHPKSVGRYEIAERLGKGAMGAVYRARDTMLHREVAIKLMAGDLVEDPNFRVRFEREARLVASISHPNVLMVYDLGYHTDGSPFMAMELLAGRDLAQVLRTNPPGPDDSAAIILHVLAGLEQAHKVGIVHRDVKPANIFMTTDGKVKVMDFGVAHLTSAALTATGTVLGTAHYMSPEQVSGRAVDGRADLFSVGCVLFEMLASRKPFEADNMMGVLFQVASAEADFTLLPSSADRLAPMLRRAMQKDPAKRYASAREFALAIQQHLREHGVSAWARHLAETVDLGRDSAEGNPLLPAFGETLARPAANPTQPTLSATGHPTVALKNATAEPEALTVAQQSAWAREKPSIQDESGGRSLNRGWLQGSAATLAVVLVAAFLWWSQAGRSDRGAPPPEPQATTAPAPFGSEVAADRTTNAEPGRPPAAAAAGASTSPKSSQSPGSNSGPRSTEALPLARDKTTAAVAPGQPAPVVQQETLPPPAPALATPQAIAPPAAPTIAPAAPEAQTTTAAPTSVPPSAVAPSPFVIGTTTAKSFDGRAASPAGKLAFRVEPESPSPAGRGVVVILLRNTGATSLQVRQAVVTITSSGDRATEPVPVVVEVRPGEEATLLRRPVRWPQAPPWSMEVIVHTRAGESYTNRMTWK